MVQNCLKPTSQSRSRLQRGPDTWMVPFCWQPGNRNTNNIKIAVKNANLCGENMQCENQGGSKREIQGDKGNHPHYARSPVPPRCNSHISFFTSTQMICLSWTRPDVYRFICFIVAMYVHHLGLYCVLFHRVLIYKTDVALQLTKLWLKKLLLLRLI